MNLEFNEDEGKLLKKILGHHHKDKDISDPEADASFTLYKRVVALLKQNGKNTTKKVNKP